MRIFRPAILAAITLALTAPAAGATVSAPAPAPLAGCVDADLAPSAATVQRVRSATLCLLNAERRKRGRRSLRSASSLQRSAAKYAHVMVRDQFFQHRSPGGSTPLSRVAATGYLKPATRWWLGENLGWGTASYATARGIVAAWMASPGHRVNVLDRRFTQIGIGIAIGTPARTADAVPGATYATEFGHRQL